MIAAENFTALTGIIVALVGFGTLLDRTSFGRQVPSSVTIMVIGILLSNVGLLPFGSPVYDVILSEFTPVGLVLLLLQTRLRTILVEARPVLGGFVIAILATLTGVAIAVAIMDFGRIEATVAGIYTASYIGGAMNFIAVARALDFTDPSLYASAVAADNAAGALFFVGLVMLSALVRGRSPVAEPAPVPDPEEEAPAKVDAGRLILVVGLAFLIVWASGGLASVLGISQFTILVMTIVTIAIANIFPAQIQRTGGVQQAGMIVMYGFFVVVGLGADFASLAGPALKFLAFAGIVISVHVAILVLCWRLFRLPLRELLTASNACILGPATAAGMAASRGWSDLVTPGVFAGVLGYAIANFIAVGVAMLLGWS
ncbi:DUF819 family protein [Sphingosinicella rhizophila]|uniref:DUF819 family protein n=1 Tax=Sphingosinicella rhizophila TaxID=3050082 RepID=A0ABU3Q5Y3_9SPHN|nr:DUF819 family protein [Sphingosinicella sp. GR2756]MDT9598811.1 DUF819 family protein [Sphingosinicella sp. GR2756]